MRSLYDTDAALAEHATADVFTHTCDDRTGALAWEIAGCIAGLVLALLSAPTFWR
jgi:hypothetical protein